nr:hypothetical protein Iba_scaffold25458CG0010 [Ipomoea batatas]
MADSFSNFDEISAFSMLHPLHAECSKTHLEGHRAPPQPSQDSETVMDYDLHLWQSGEAVQFFEEIYRATISVARQMNVQSSKALACVISGLASGEDCSMSRIRSTMDELYFGDSGIR